MRKRKVFATNEMKQKIARLSNEGIQHKEIAEIMGVSVATVGRVVRDDRMSRATIMVEKTGRMEKADHHLEICIRLNETFQKKNKDYGDSFNQVRDRYKEFPVILIRLEDKFNRLQSLLLSKNGRQVNDESIEDTLLDLANYCIMEVMAREASKWQNIVKGAESS